MSERPEPDQLAAVELEHVSFRYGQAAVLDDVSLSISRGEAVALVGSSGAGKTTLLRLIAGMLAPTSGSLTTYGAAPHELRDRRKRSEMVGMVQQRLDLVPQLSVRHNVEAGMLGRWSLWRSLAGLFLPIEHAGSREAIAQVGLAGLERERVSRLSGGEQQRVAIARALAQDPKIIVADEPVASLDPTLADQVLQAFRAVASEEGKTVIASLHTPEMARDHFDRVVGVKSGRVAFDVPASELSREMLDAVYDGQPPAVSDHVQETGTQTSASSAPVR